MANSPLPVLSGDFDLVIFDCDGVLVDSEVLSCQCLVEVLRDYGVAISVEEVFERFLGRSSAALESYFVAHKGHALPADFHVRANTRLTEVFRQSLRLMPGVTAVLSGLDLPFCLATSSDPQRIAMTLAVSGLNRFFVDRVFTASMVKNGKPAPDLFLLAAATMGVDPQRTLVIEDSVNGVLAGKSAGMTVWGFTGGSHYATWDGNRLLAGAGADRIFKALADLKSV